MKKYLLHLFSILLFLFPFNKGYAQQTVLNGANTTPITFPAGACVYNWTNDNTSIGLAASGTGNIASFTAVNTGNGPVKATITATPTTGGFAYVPNSGDGTVSVVNTATNTVKSTIQVGSFPFAVAASPDGSRVYVTNEYSNSVSVINTADNTVMATVAVGTLPDGVAVSPDGTRAYIANNGDNLINGVNTVSVINTLTNAVVSTVTVGQEPLGVAVSPDGTLVYVTNSYSNTVSVIQTATNTVSATISVGTHPFGVCFSPDGSKAYVTNHDVQTVSVINTATETVVATVSVGVSPYRVCSSPDGKYVYVANLTDNTVSVINTASNNVTSTIPVGALPYGICISPDGNSVYVVTRGTKSISTINTTTNTVSASTIVGTDPYSFGNFITNGSPCGGTPVTFTITVNPSSSTIRAGAATGTISSCIGAASANPNIQQFTVSGSGLTANITATAPAGFEISLNAGTGYGTSVTIPQTSGAVNSTVVYVRSAAAAPAGSISGNVTLTSAGASSQTVAVTATINALPTVNAVANQTVTNGAPTAAVSFTGTGNTFNWVNDTPGVGLAASGTGDIASFNAVNTWNSPVVATVTVTPLRPFGFAYITNVTNNTLSVINLTTGVAVASIPVGTLPGAVAISPDGKWVYVANISSNSVSVINTATNQLIATIPLTSSPGFMAITPDGSHIYVTNQTSATVSVISTATNSVIATIAIPGNDPLGILVSPDGSKAYVTVGSSVVVVINTLTNNIVATISVGTDPIDLAQSPDGKLLYVSNYMDGTISVINTVTDIVVSTIPCGSRPYGITISHDGSKLYVANSSGGITIINTASNTVENTFSVSVQPYAIDLSADGTFLYVEPINGANMLAINTLSNTVAAYIPVSSPLSFGHFITGGDGCSGAPVTFTITVNPTSPTITATTASGTISACTGAASASPNIQQFTVSGSGLTGNITATAPPGGGFEVSLVSGSGYGNSITIPQTAGAVSSTVVYVRSAASVLAGGIFGNVTLTSPGAPSQTVAVTGTVNPVGASSLTISASVNNVCAGTPVTFTATPTNGGTSPVYQWQLNGSNAGTNNATFSSSAFANGDVVSCVITSNLACAVPASITSNSITTNIFPLPVVKGGGDKTIKKGNGVTLTATASANIADITWSPVTGLDNNKILNPKASPLSTTLYTITVQTAAGCMATDSVTVTVFDEISIPNTFTPNGDGVNDTWEIKYLSDYPGVTVNIFNRWGQQVFTSVGYVTPWDGKYNGAPLPTGTYYYIVDLHNGHAIMSGWVAIVR